MGGRVDPEGAARDQREAAQAAKRATEFQTTVNEALNNEALWKEERLRWRVALGLLIAFAGLIGFCWLGCGAKALTNNIEAQWKKIIEPPKKQTPRNKPKKEPRTIRIYNKYCPHHYNHRKRQHQINCQPLPTSDPYFPGSETWNYRMRFAPPEPPP